MLVLVLVLELQLAGKSFAAAIVFVREDRNLERTGSLRNYCPTDCRKLSCRRACFISILVAALTSFPGELVNTWGFVAAVSFCCDRPL